MGNAVSGSDYKLGEQLGKGAFGTVYKAMYMRPCALKSIDISQLSQAEKAEKKEEWKKEVNALIKVRGHDNIVEYRNSFADTNNKLWVEMEYCNGGTFNDYAIEKKPGNATKHRLMVEISSGVAFLHAQGVVHRDLKPENILISIDEDNSPHAKVADFGLAKVIASCHLENTMVKYYLQSGCGTEYFMAPEVFDGHYTDKADVFSMGIIFNAMVPNITYKTLDGKKLLLQWLPPGFGGLTSSQEGIPYSKYIHERSSGLTCSGVLEGKVGQQVIDLLNAMIKKKYNDRPSAEEVVSVLRSISPKELSLLAQPPKTSGPPAFNAI